eukprot:801984-Rhodomonas_salina.1
MKRAFPPSSVGRSCLLPSVHASISDRPRQWLDSWFCQYWLYPVEGSRSVVLLGCFRSPVHPMSQSCCCTRRSDCHTRSAPGG